MAIYLPGPPICGFYGFFEADYGDPETPKPYPRVTPSRVGEAVLPFHCPHCERPIDFTRAERREHYHDHRPERRGHYWCPACDGRFHLNASGPEWKGGALDLVGAAPSVVERVRRDGDGFIEVARTVMGAVHCLRDLYVLGTDVLGAG